MPLRPRRTSSISAGAGARGQHAKMANQIAIAGPLSGVCEALTYAGAKGLPNALLSAISTGAAGCPQR